jgi:hypothetical protein
MVKERSVEVDSRVVVRLKVLAVKDVRDRMLASQP